jgi:mycothiol system anti-sigma-R factor
LSPTDCEHVLRQIELYLDGELDPAIHVEVSQHLSTCHPCTHHAAFQTRMKELLRSKCGCEPPAYLVERIRVIVERHPQAP